MIDADPYLGMASFCGNGEGITNWVGEDRFIARSTGMCGCAVTIVDDGVHCTGLRLASVRGRKSHQPGRHVVDVEPSFAFPLDGDMVVENMEIGRAHV